MDESKSYAAIVQRCLDRVDDGFDKREGSLIYDAIAPAAAEIAQAYMELSGFESSYVYPDDMTGDNLTRKAAERGVIRYAATPAVLRAAFTDRQGAPMNPPLGSRFSAGEMTYVVTEPIAAGASMVQCETAGSVGNAYTGPIIPIEYIDNLGTAAIVAVLVPGEDEESDEALYARYEDSLTGESFGGNVKDYIKWANAIAGVGGTRVHPVWNGGGTVKLVIVSAAWGVPSSELVAHVQEVIDPVPYNGQGLGTAPVGHYVTVVAADGVALDIRFNLVLQSGTTWAQLKPAAETAMAAYLEEVVQGWQEADAAVVRISQIETRMLALSGVVDVGGTTINGTAANLVMQPDEIPVFGSVDVL